MKLHHSLSLSCQQNWWYLMSWNSSYPMLLLRNLPKASKFLLSPTHSALGTGNHVVGGTRWCGIPCLVRVDESSDNFLLFFFSPRRIPTVEDLIDPLAPPSWNQAVTAGQCVVPVPTLLVGWFYRVNKDAIYAIWWHNNRVNEKNKHSFSCKIPCLHKNQEVEKSDRMR